MLFFKIII